MSIDELIDNLESGKRNHCFGKKSRKSLKRTLNLVIYTFLAIVFCDFFFVFKSEGEEDDEEEEEEDEGEEEDEPGLDYLQKENLEVHI